MRLCRGADFEVAEEEMNIKCQCYKCYKCYKCYGANAVEGRDIDPPCPSLKGRELFSPFKGDLEGLFMSESGFCGSGGGDEYKMPMLQVL